MWENTKSLTSFFENLFCAKSAVRSFGRMSCENQSVYPVINTVNNVF